MALLLSLETATTVCSVALAKDGRVIAHKEVNGAYTHAENLTRFIEQVVSEADSALHLLDAVAVSKGPGSYTGLRIGVSTAKGLCYALNKPLIAINTLEHTAYVCAQKAGDKEGLYCPMIDARRMEVYCAVFDYRLQPVLETTALVIDGNSFKELLQNQVIYFSGDGAAKCKAVLSHYAKAEFIDEFYPSAANMALLAEERFNRKAFEDVAYFEPFYLKDFVVGKKKES